MSAHPIGVGVIGLGFMGRQHIASYASADAAGLRNRLVAVADADPARRAGQVGPLGNLEAAGAVGTPGRGTAGMGAAGSRAGAAPRAFDARRVRAYASAAELLDDREVELVSICSWTPAHVDHAVAALAAGKHVLVEKPVALNSREAARLTAAARGAETLCMPAMCMRFWPAWSWLQHAIRSRRFGAVRSAVFTRVGSHPGGAAASHPFYGDPLRTGGALFDLHVHDADFVRFCFGPPTEVVCGGDVNHLTALYRFADAADAGVSAGAEGRAALLPGAHVAAEGGWSHDPAAPFRMRYTVAFEEATADWDLLRDPALLVACDGVQEPVMLAPGTGYDWEIRHLLAAIASGSTALLATAADAEALTRQLEAEGESLRSGRPVVLRG